MEKIEIKEGRKYWTITLDADDIFNRVSRDTNYREHAMEAGGAKYILLEDDRSLFDRMLKKVAGELWLRLARMSKRVERGIVDSGDALVMRLEVTTNHDDNILFTLGGSIDDFMDSGILREWYIRNNLADEIAKSEHMADIALSNIISAVHYRKKAVKRPINPLF